MLAFPADSEGDVITVVATVADVVGNAVASIAARRFCFPTSLAPQRQCNPLRPTGAAALCFTQHTLISLLQRGSFQRLRCCCWPSRLLTLSANTCRDGFVGDESSTPHGSKLQTYDRQRREQRYTECGACSGKESKV